MKLIVGLGNPEEKYAGTRHNLGFDTLEEFRLKVNAPLWTVENKFQSEISQFRYVLDGEEEQIILARPQTYMNNSGLAVSKLVHYFNKNHLDVVVVYDELDLRLGHIKIRQGGAAAGHHGVESIIETLGTDDFIRVRLGIGNLKTVSAEHDLVNFDASHYVLEPFLPNERSDARKMIKKAIEVLETYLEKGLDETQNQFH